MTAREAVNDRPDRRELPSRKAEAPPAGGLDVAPDGLGAWAERYLDLAVRGVRSAEVAAKVARHLGRFRDHVVAAYGHDRLSAVVRRDVVAWREALVDAGLAPATVNNHLASLSGFATWVTAHAPGAFVRGNPTKGVGTLALPPLEPRALTAAQVRSLKNLCDRLERFHQLKGRRRVGRAPGEVPAHAHGRPVRDRAIVYALLSTGLRREELVRLDLAQVEPAEPEALRPARRARLVGVRGKGKTQRTVFLSADARTALAEYLERERPGDADASSAALILSARSVRSRRPGGRLSPRAVNAVLERVGRFHDAEVAEPARRVGPLRPHDLRHTFAFALAEATGADAYELERRLGHRSARYVARYTNPPEAVAASYVEEL